MPTFTTTTDDLKGPFDAYADTMALATAENAVAEVKARSLSCSATG